MPRSTQQTCSTAGPLCMIHSPFSMYGQRFLSLCLSHSFSIRQVLHSSNARLSPWSGRRGNGLAKGREKAKPRTRRSFLRGEIAAVLTPVASAGVRSGHAATPRVARLDR
jgi:hypothetical protein